MKIARNWYIYLLCLSILACKSEQQQAESGPKPIQILFLGHDSEHHNSEVFMPMLAAPLFRKGINLTYTEDQSDLNDETLSKYDGLIIYANHEDITSSQEEALLDFIEGGKGFIPIHSASFCFLNSEAYIDLVGAQFHSHDTGTFVTEIIQPDHPAMEGVEKFAAWDETYVHHKHNDDKTVLMERVEGDHHEPWTWVREQGDGRVFYTASGHDERVWSNPGFHKMMEKGILWAVSDQAKEQWQAYVQDIPELQYVDKDSIPNYEKRDPAPKYQLPLSPEESKKLIQVPPGFSLELFASEPDIINPIAMDWDEKGRLWVIETVDYPNTVREDSGVGDDRIKICEDTDGDGKADKFTVFADQLNIPTSLAFVNGGVIVSQAPNFLFLKDTNGDDKADERQVLVDGWGTFDTHAGPSNLKYGIDNWIWGVVGYSGFEGTIAGKNQQFGQGIYRLKPDASEFEFMTRTSNNTWGLGFTETFDVFASTANNTHSVYMGIPNSYYENVDGLPVNGSTKIDGHYAMQTLTPFLRQVDVWGGFTAAAGHNFYTARSFPKEYWNRIALVCEPTGRVLHNAIIEKEGAGFVEKNGGNLLVSADDWMSPVEARVGPDGAVWVADWYNFIIQHNPTPTPERGGYNAETGEGNAYVNPLRDRQHGRIWRIVYKEAEPYEPMQLSMDDPEALVEALSNDNMFWRLTAQRLLVERGETDILPELYDLVEDRKADDMGLNNGALHALWTMHGLGVLEDGVNEEAYRIAVAALNHPAAGVRKAAVQVMPRTPWANQAILKSQVVNDPDPHTLMAATLALADMPTSDGLGERLFTLSQEENVQQDAWLSKAAYLAGSRHREGFMAAYLRANPKYEALLAKKASMPSREDLNYEDNEWKLMALPEFLERSGLDIDGIIWFRKNINLSAQAAGKAGTISLGRIDETDEVWINGIRVGGTKDDARAERVYPIPADLLKPGNNMVVVKLTDARGWGGFSGEPEQMFVQLGNSKTSLAGNWKYQVEKEFDQRSLPFEGTTLADALMENYWNKPVQTQMPATLTASSDDEVQMEAQVVQINTVKNAMKYDVSEFVVEAGKSVKIVFDNPDFMQHNLLIVQPGTLETVGAAADKMATDPQGAEKNYVPEIPEVLFSTPLLDPEASIELTFIAPDEPGEYPFVCTFPGHWRIMQGVMKVVGTEAI
ncbi:PVC-type heme-binding CxxCH protein [Catalinimonas niigatensis]|uniref:PVC-type heme-binding CxxCH protein n=1 Tax=Catalinimonas niigatensis TaxID=1397264 RepID=UPI0026668AC1|nr:PVC-type heme-binding CxxCH protein [Catalinimonas niigatensis]WPP51674.1 PVC-type heme-binding CxxCH protein [Catalinimonas niigatensis]